MHSLIKQSANSIENPWLIKAKLDDMPDIIWLGTENWCKSILEMFLISWFMCPQRFFFLLLSIEFGLEETYVLNNTTKSSGCFIFFEVY